MTRRDLQGEMKKQGRPWCIGKAFERVGADRRAAIRRRECRIGAETEIRLDVNGQPRQASAHRQADLERRRRSSSTCRAAWTLAPGDLIFTGTPRAWRRSVAATR